MITDRKKVNSIIFLMMFTYMVSYLTRINLGTVISEIIASENITKSALSPAVTGAFITYGVGQLVSGFFCDRIRPKRLITYGLMLTVAMNIILPFCPNTILMTVVWCINGFAQSFMWPPLVKLMTELFSNEDYLRASVRANWGGSIGTILLYLVSPLIISIANWKGVFFFSATSGIIMLVIWQICCPDVEVSHKVQQVEETAPAKKLNFFSPMMLCLVVAIIIQGALRDGITTWTPSYISETYNLSSSISILTGVLLPIFSIISFQITSALHEKVFKNPLICAGVLYIFGLIAASLITVFNKDNAFLSAILLALLNGSLHGVNLLLICILPRYFKKFGNVGFISGFLNACTYIGSAISTYGIAVVSDNFGWNTTLLIWIGAVFVGLVLCFSAVRPWKKTMQD